MRHHRAAPRRRNIEPRLRDGKFHTPEYHDQMISTPPPYATLRRNDSIEVSPSNVPPQYSSQGRLPYFSASSEPNDASGPHSATNPGAGLPWEQYPETSWNQYPDASFWDQFPLSMWDTDFSGFDHMSDWKQTTSHYNDWLPDEIMTRPWDRPWEQRERSWLRETPSQGRKDVGWNKTDSRPWEGRTDAAADLGPWVQPQPDVVPTEQTTMMMRNLPRSFPQTNLLALLELDFSGHYDFVYLPFSFDKKQNLGFAFINFRTPQKASEFFVKYNRTTLPSPKGVHSRTIAKSPRVINVSIADIQGRDANMSRVVRECKVGKISNPRFQPVVLDEAGNRLDFATLTIIAHGVARRRGHHVTRRRWRKKKMWKRKN